MIVKVDWNVMVLGHRSDCDRIDRMIGVIVIGVMIGRVVIG